MKLAFWNSRRVLVTGHTGFKGSWLSLWLSHLNARVTGYALDPPTACNFFSDVRVARDVADVRGDIRDYPRLKACLTERAPEVVFHLAAQPLVGESYKAPLATFESNVMGTANILQACREQTSVRSIVLVTTDKVYKNREWDWGYREIDPLGGHDPYSASKACCELVAESFRSSFYDAPESSAGVATVRAGNVIGGGDWAENRLVPDVIRSLARGEKVQLRFPLSVRPWQHVLDPLHGYLQIAERLHRDPRNWGGSWNFGPGFDDALNVESLVEMIISRWGSGSWLSNAEPNEFHETERLHLDCSKAKQQLGWSPRLNLRQAVEFTVDWYKAEASGRNDLRRLALAQIAQFQMVSSGGGQRFAA